MPALEIGRILVFLQSAKKLESGDHMLDGPVLYVEQPFKGIIEEWNGATDVGDLNFSSFPGLLGLVVWEGWVEWDGDPANEGSEANLRRRLAKAQSLGDVQG